LGLAALDPTYEKVSAHYQPRVLALAFGEAARLHPVVGAAEQREIVIIDVLVAHEGAQQLVRRQRPLGMRGHVVGVFVEIGIDHINRPVLGVVVGLALLSREIGRDHFAAAVERGSDDVGAFLEAQADERLHHGHSASAAGRRARS